jgi:PleD family two-component response regulator
MAAVGLSSLRILSTPGRDAARNQRGGSTHDAAAMSYSSKLETVGQSDPPRKFRVMLVDDHPITRQGVRAVLSGVAAFEVCGEADDQATALQLAASAQPDLAVVDVALGATNGFALTREL